MTKEKQGTMILLMFVYLVNGIEDIVEDAGVCVRRRAGCPTLRLLVKVGLTSAAAAAYHRGTSPRSSLCGCPILGL